MFFHMVYKKLTRRWDSERELSLRRHRTRRTKYNSSCINSATARRGGYVLERMFTKFSEITQCNGHYAVQGHSRSPILAPILTLTLSLGRSPANTAINDTSLKTTFFGLHFCRRKYPCIFGLTPRRRGFPGTINVKFYLDVVRSPAYYMA